jgi:IMP dehydrogenase
VKNTVCFDDVLLVPGFSDITSRKDIDLSMELESEMVFELPLISSPMDTVTELDMCVAMNSAGGLGVVHRYNSIEDQSNIVRSSSEIGFFTAAAVGVAGDYIDRATALYDAGARILCVDIAHGHHILMKKALISLREIFGDVVHIMAGNVATLEGFNALSDWGADSVRVGIGGGSICSTRIQTGHGVPTLQSIIDCSYSDREATLIADGGIKTSGDIVKVLAAGADFVMLGSLLAGTFEAPGEIIYLNGHAEKVYRGMASKDAQIDWRGHTSSVEGVSSTVPVKGAVSDVIKTLEVGIRSGLSYSGAYCISDLQAKSNFIIQSSAGALESSTHIDRLY